MDSTALRNRIQATLDANADVRRQAELDLKNVRYHENAVVEFEKLIASVG